MKTLRILTILVTTAFLCQGGTAHNSSVKIKNDTANSHSQYVQNHFQHAQSGKRVAWTHLSQSINTAWTQQLKTVYNRVAFLTQTHEFQISLLFSQMAGGVVEEVLEYMAIEDNDISERTLELGDLFFYLSSLVTISECLVESPEEFQKIVYSVQPSDIHPTDLQNPKALASIYNDLSNLTGLMIKTNVKHAQENVSSLNIHMLLPSTKKVYSKVDHKTRPIQEEFAWILRRVWIFLLSEAKTHNIEISTIVEQNAAKLNARGQYQYK